MGQIASELIADYGKTAEAPVTEATTETTTSAAVEREPLPSEAADEGAE